MMQTTRSVLPFIALVVGFLLILSKAIPLVAVGILLVLAGLYAPFFEDLLGRFIPHKRSTEQDASSMNFYPYISLAQVSHYLELDLPVWYLDLEGVLYVSNLLAFWLWGAIQPSDTILQVSKLLGKNLFNVYSKPDNFDRIVKPKSIDDDSAAFYRKKLAVARELLASKNVTDELSKGAYSSFINAVCKAGEQNSVLKDIYLRTKPNQELEWSYSLRIHSPDEPSKILEFEATVMRVIDKNTPSGYIAIYRPIKQTIPIIKQEYEHLLERFDERAYIQYISDDMRQLLTKLAKQTKTSYWSASSN
jgi:hypothetical protein